MTKNQITAFRESLADRMREGIEPQVAWLAERFADELADPEHREDLYEIREGNHWHVSDSPTPWAMERLRRAMRLALDKAAYTFIQETSYMLPPPVEMFFPPRKKKPRKPKSRRGRTDRSN